jgi:hypothetical protein
MDDTTAAKLDPFTHNANNIALHRFDWRRSSSSSSRLAIAATPTRRTQRAKTWRRAGSHGAPRGSSPGSTATGSKPVLPRLKQAGPRPFFERDGFDAVRRKLPEGLQTAAAIAYTYGWRMPSEVRTLEWRHVVSRGRCAPPGARHDARR